MQKLIVIPLIMLLSLAPVADARASSPESGGADERIIRLASYASILGGTVIHHHLSLGVDKGAADAFEPLLAAFANRLYGLETEFGKVTVRYEGAFDDINPDDFTGIVLAWNGDPLEFDFTATRKIKHGRGRDLVTDIYLDITVNYEKPGVYSFTGKYAGAPFTLYIGVNFERVAKSPADPASLTHLSVTYLPADEVKARPVTDISFHFGGVHEWFGVNDLRDVRLTNGGLDVPFGLHDYIVRHFVYDGDGNASGTVFTLVLTNPLTTPGVYRLSGFYGYERFDLSWMQLN